MSETSQQGDIRPIPDPTALSTAANLRLEEMLRNLIKIEIAHLDEISKERLASITNQFTIQFAMLETRTAEQKKDTKDALDAALAAAKEAVANQSTSSEKSITKSETATIERIKAVETLLSASSTATDDKIDDLKSRIVAIEAVKLGNAEGAATVRQGGVDTRAIIATIVGVIGVLIAVASILFAIMKP